MKNLNLKTLAFVLTASVLGACSNQDDVVISYDPGITITAGHIFDSFDAYNDNDFRLDDKQWAVNINVLVYDQADNLVAQEVKQSQTLGTEFKFDGVLTEGEYTIVSVASFVSTASNYKYWTVGNIDKLSTLSITETEDIKPSPFETLGISVDKYSVTEKKSSIAINIKPVTVLCEFFMNDSNVDNWGSADYCWLAKFIESYSIYAPKYKNAVRFEDGKPSYKYSDHDTKHVICTSKPYDETIDKDSKCLTMVYRAMLPESDMQFGWDMVLKSQPTFNIPASASANSVNMAEGEQYVVNMILEYTDMYTVQYTPDYIYSVNTNARVAQHNTEYLNNTLDYHFENLLGHDQRYISNFLGCMVGYDTHTDLYYVDVYPQFAQQLMAGQLEACYETRARTNCVKFNLRLKTMDTKMCDQLVAALKDMYRFKAQTANVYEFCEKDAPEGEEVYLITLQAQDLEDIKVSYTYAPLANELLRDYGTLLGKAKSDILAFFGDNVVRDIGTMVAVNEPDYDFINNVFLTFTDDVLQKASVNLNDKADSNAILDYLQQKLTESDYSTPASGLYYFYDGANLNESTYEVLYTTSGKRIDYSLKH